MLSSKLHKHLNHQERGAVAFGLMDGVATVLGVAIGVFAAGEGKVAVMAASLAGGFADAFANGVGTKVSQEVEGVIDIRTINRSSIGAFLATALMTVIQVLPIVFLPLELGLIVSALIGFSILFCLGIFFMGNTNIAIKYVFMGLVAATFAFIIGKSVRILLNVE